MTWIQAVASVVIAILLPFAVNLCASKTCSGDTKRFIAIAASIAAGIASGIAFGIPTEPETLLVWSFAIVGGVQTSYAAFKKVGVTHEVLDALANIELKK